MVSVRISNARFDLLSADYEQEHKQIKEEITRLQDLIDEGEQERYDLNQILKNVRKYTDPETLTAEMVNELIDKIIVHSPDKSSGHRKQKIEIYYKVSIINLAEDEELITEDGRKDRWLNNLYKHSKRRHRLKTVQSLYIKFRYRTCAFAFCLHFYANSNGMCAFLHTFLFLS